MEQQTCEKGPKLGFKELPTYKIFLHCVHGIPQVQMQAPYPKVPSYGAPPAPHAFVEAFIVI